MFVEFLFLLGFLAVASNPSPYYAALGLVGGAGVGCLLLAKIGVTFLSLVLFLVYLGGMMVVFAYCAALVAEPYPEAWGSRMVVGYLWVYVLFLIWWFMEGKECSLYTGFEAGVSLVDWWGVAGVLNSGGWMLFFVGWGLLLTLFVVLEIVGGHKSSVLRAV
uniref:NADH-ubiquinone oxidoreductase chain 6 n=1 Tax=Phrynobatrachus keniensis TaxID=467738 RepID=S4V1A2_9NEOB|nr:NADH dehydrogenase subunit 6 [Phrynobatrachus keniensis]